ncbi:MAG TPA: DUF1902 domain-containing protein [Caulobacteraceae bacterium]|jgi:hypothetical protein
MAQLKSSYYVRALWDPEASVWTSESDVPGLVIEANTLTEFEALVWELAPEMLQANEPAVPPQVSIDFSAAARRDLAIAS